MMLIQLINWGPLIHSIEHADENTEKQNMSVKSHLLQNTFRDRTKVYLLLVVCN